MLEALQYLGSQSNFMNTVNITVPPKLYLAPSLKPVQAVPFRAMFKMQYVVFMYHDSFMCCSAKRPPFTFRKICMCVCG